VSSYSANSSETQRLWIQMLYLLNRVIQRRNPKYRQGQTQVVHNTHNKAGNTSTNPQNRQEIQTREKDGNCSATLNKTSFTDNERENQALMGLNQITRSRCLW